MSKLAAAAKRWRERFARPYLAAKAFLTRREEGATMSEYALLAGLLALACAVGIRAMANGMSNAFNALRAWLP
jgi:Flp pilus assembly pilin Flp